MRRIDDRLTFSEVCHIYYLDGFEVLSPTTVFEITGITDFSRVNREVLERAQAFGRCVHKACQLYDKGILDTEALDPLLAPYLNGWKAFLRDTGYEIAACEETVYNLAHNYAGTLDRVTKCGVLIDIKSSDSIHVSTALQTAAYAKAWESMGRGKVRERMGVRVGQDEYQIVRYPDKTDFDDFVVCLKMAYLKRKLKIA